jgi:hypothetical protein
MVVTRVVGGVNVSATANTRAIVTAASKGVATAITAHEWRSLDTKTLPEVGHIISRATTDDFIKIGVLAGTSTDIGVCVSSIDGDTVSTHSNETHLEPVREVSSIDLVYTMNISDSHGMAYCGQVLMDADMRAVCAEDSNVPISLYALRNLRGYSPVFDKDIAGIVEIMERAFSGVGVDHVQTDGHVSINSSGRKRVFPTDAEQSTNHILKSQRNTTMLFDPDRTPTHTITVDSMRALRARPVHQRYLATQGVSIDHIGTGYQFHLVMSCTNVHTENEIVTDSPNYVNASLPVRMFSTDEGYAPRQSLVHVFVDGGHFAMNVTHICNSNAARSLHLPVYAAMNKLVSLNLCSELSVKDAMCNGTMETMHGDDSIPFVVLKSESFPLVAVFTSTFTPTGRCRCPGNCRCHDVEGGGDPDKCDSSSSDEDVEHVMETPEVVPSKAAVAPFSIENENTLPMPVRLALLRQWGGMA